MKRDHTLPVLAVIVLVLLLAMGALFIARPTVIDLKRQESENEMIAMIEDGQTDISGLYLPEVEGEEQEFTEIGSGNGETVEVTGCGVIVIDKIDLKMAVVEGADAYSLRAAAGWLPESAEMGSAGNCVIFGHRMYDYGRHFNRLDELRTGDSITLYDADGGMYTYTVTGKEVIEPGVLMDTLAAHNEGFCLTLVTCTPTGVGSHRLLVYAELAQ